jgi:5-methyltetrahydrofolate--homocysteine methyltransferase
MMGIAPKDMLDTMIEAGAEIIGANCGNGVKDMIDVVRDIRSNDANIPILIHANAGVPIYQDGKTVFPETPDEMASYIDSILEAGVNAVGGCCGTTPEHIRKIVDIVRRA